MGTLFCDVVSWADSPVKTRRFSVDNLEAVEAWAKKHVPDLSSQETTEIDETLRALRAEGSNRVRLILVDKEGAKTLFMEGEKDGFLAAFFKQKKIQRWVQTFVRLLITAGVVTVTGKLLGDEKWSELAFPIGVYGTMSAAVQYHINYFIEFLKGAKTTVGTWLRWSMIQASFLLIGQTAAVLSGMSEVGVTEFLMGILLGTVAGVSTQGILDSSISANHRIAVKGPHQELLDLEVDSESRVVNLGIRPVLEKRIQDILRKEYNADRAAALKILLSAAIGNAAAISITNQFPGSNVIGGVIIAAGLLNARFTHLRNRRGCQGIL